MIISQVVDKLKKASEAYYNSSNPIMTDDEFDALLRLLSRLDPENPFLSEVGSPIDDTAPKVGRAIPMGTLSKYHSLKDVKKWYDSIPENHSTVLLCPKYDGFGVELVYVNGKLVEASTRGTGYVGESVIESIKYVNHVPDTLLYADPEVIIRGEVIIPRSNHEKVKSLGYTAMRNAIPGIVRSCNKYLLRYADFVAYEIIDSNSDRISQRTNRSYKDFMIEDYVTTDDISEFDSIYDRFYSDRDEYPYELDGVVIKTNTIMGTIEDMLCPKYSIAWKFKSKYETTILRGIEYQMGITGKFTPIANFDEVEFQGAKLTRASLGSMDRLKELIRDQSLCIGSLIEVTRRGDIIPYVERVSPDDALSDLTRVPIDLPTFCPYCLSSLEDNQLCTNYYCDQKIFMRFSQYIRSIGVKGIGESTVAKLVKEYRLTRLTELYSIDLDTLQDRLGISAGSKIRETLEKKISALQLLVAYPFDNIGSKAWISVLDHVSLAGLLEVSSRSLRPDFIRYLLSEKIKGLTGSKGEDLAGQFYDNKREIGALYDRVVRFK